MVYSEDEILKCINIPTIKAHHKMMVDNGSFKLKG